MTLAPDPPQTVVPVRVVNSAVRMNDLNPTSNSRDAEASSVAAWPVKQDLSPEKKRVGPFTFKRLRASVLVVVGYLLSPLCWWNDLVINLPLALAFGYLLSLLYPAGLVPFTIAGYWLSNVVGMILMQQGAVDILRPDAEQNPRKALLSGILTSTLYTALIVGLLQLKVLEMPDIFSPELWTQVSNYLPSWFQPLS